MLKNRAGRSGFTLPEVLVTVAIVAVLAAVVVPAVTQQIGRADAPSFNASVGSLRTAITSFVSDVRAYPGQLDHLQADIDAADFTLFEDGDGTGAPLYTAAQVARWRGPYDNSGAVNGVITLGMDWQTTNVLQDSGYVVVSLTKAAGATVTDAAELDAAVDGANGAGAGLIRWDVTATPALTPANTVRLFLMSSAK